MIYQPESVKNPSNFRSLQRGITVFTGPMFSGKTTALINKLERYTFAKIEYVLFSPKKDDRYSETEVVTHSKESLPAVKIGNIEEVYPHIESIKERQRQEGKSQSLVVGIDEAMMFDYKIIEVCSNLRKLGHPVFVSCCDMDVFLNPFQLRDANGEATKTHIGELFAIANEVVKLTAICDFNENGHICGNQAHYTWLNEGVNQEDFLNGVVVGSNIYQAVCDLHHPFVSGNI